MARNRDILAAIDRSSLKRRGTLREWMRRNHEAFARKLQEVRPEWDVLAKLFADGGFTDARGNIPTSGETVRKTWFRVRKEMLERGVKKDPAPRRQAPVRPVAVPVEPEAPPVQAPVAEPGDPMAEILAQWDERSRKMPEPINKGGKGKS